MAAIQSAVDKLKSSVAAKLPPVEDYVTRRLVRGRARMREDASLRNLCLRFWRGDQYSYLNKEGYLVKQGTLIDSDKPRHRFRQVRNVLIDAVEHEVSATTKRVPSYEVDPSTNDPEDIAGAEIASKVSLWGYDDWSLRSVTERVVELAIVADEGFAWPYFDNQIGTPIGTDDDGSVVCEGDIRVRVLNGNQVYWEPGVRFEDSRWHAVEEARTIDEVMGMPGYTGGALKPDVGPTDTSDGRTQKGEMVMVTVYLERPSPKKPDGRTVTTVAGKRVVPDENYPCRDHEGSVVDEPVLHKLSRLIDPDSDRDMGLVRHAIDPCRTYHDCTNKQLEWKNLALNCQVFFMGGSGLAKGQKLNDEPGKAYTVTGQTPPAFRPVPPIPGELQQLKDEAEAYIRSLFAQNDIPSGIDAAKAIQVLIERDENRREAFTARLAEFHSRLMRHCLYLVQRHFTEQRIARIRGRFGPDTIYFTGADMRGQADVRVFPGSIEPLTRAAMTQTVMNYAQMQWISPEKAMWAIQNGTMEDLIDSYDLMIAKVQRQIRQIMGMATFAPGSDVPDAVPYGNPKVALYVLHNWMLTEEFDRQPPGVQQAANLLERQYQMLDDQQEQKAAAAQAALAQQQGMSSATRPPGAPPMPSLPGIPTAGAGQ